MKDTDVSENHQNNCLKVVIALANFLGTDTTFYDIKNKEQITAFLDTKVKSHEEDPFQKGQLKCNKVMPQNPNVLYYFDAGISYLNRYHLFIHRHRAFDFIERVRGLMEE